MGRSRELLLVLLLVLPVLLVLCAGVLPGAPPRLTTPATPLKNKVRKQPRATSKTPSGGGGGGGGGGKGGPASTSKPATSTASPQAQPAPGGGFSPASSLSAASRARLWTANSTAEAGLESPEEKKKETI